MPWLGQLHGHTAHKCPLSVVPFSVAIRPRKDVSLMELTVDMQACLGLPMPVVERAVAGTDGDIEAAVDSLLQQAVLDVSSINSGSESERRLAVGAQTNGPIGQPTLQAAHNVTGTSSNSESRDSSNGITSGGFPFPSNHTKSPSKSPDSVATSIHKPSPSSTLDISTAWSDLGAQKLSSADDAFLASSSSGGLFSKSQQQQQQHAWSSQQHTSAWEAGEKRALPSLPAAESLFGQPATSVSWHPISGAPPPQSPFAGQPPPPPRLTLGTQQQQSNLASQQRKHQVAGSDLDLEAVQRLPPQLQLDLGLFEDHSSGFGQLFADRSVAGEFLPVFARQAWGSISFDALRCLDIVLIHMQALKQCLENACFSTQMLRQGFWPNFMVIPC